MLMIGSKNKRQIAKERKAFLNGAVFNKLKHLVIQLTYYVVHKDKKRISFQIKETRTVNIFSIKKL